MKICSKATFGLLLVGALLAGTVWSPDTAAADEVKPLVIGHLGDWTGPAGMTCGPIGDAFILYFHEYINKERGGISYTDPKTGQAGQVKVKVEYADCRYELPLFKSAYRDFVDQGVVMIHTTSSPAIEALKKDYKRDKIPCVISTGNTVGLWPPGWIYGHRGTFADDVGVYVKWIKANWKEKRAPRMAMMYHDGPFGRSMLWGGPEYAKANGFEIVADEPIPAMPVDMSGQLLRIKQAKADFIIVNILGSQAAVLLKDMKRIGLDIPLFILTCTDAVELSDLAGEAAEGAYYTSYTDQVSWDDNLPPVKWTNEHFRKYMKGKAGYDVEKRPYATGLWFAGWFIADIAKEALRLALEKVPPDKLTGADVRDYGFNRMKDYDVHGLCKGITYYPGQDHRGGHWKNIHRVKYGKDSIISDWIEEPTLMPPWMKDKK